MTAPDVAFFSRDDDRPDAEFYSWPRLVTHIDADAVAAVGQLYAEYGIDGATPGCRVLDLMSSWVSHFVAPPSELVVLGLNAHELAANPAATATVVQDLNAETLLPFADADFDAVVCCVSIDYLTRPVEVLSEVARVLRPSAPVVLTFSDRCFPTKAIRGWLAADDAARGDIVAGYLRRTGGFTPPEVALCTPSDPAYNGDPLWAVTARRLDRQ